VKRAGWILLAAMAVGLAACSSTSTDEDLLNRLANLDKDTIFQKAEELYAKEDYEEARKYFQFIYDSFPNDPLGHKAALRVADTYAVKKDSINLTEARLRYRDFANRYPNDPDRDEALLKLGNTYFVRRGRPDLDLTNAREAMAAYQQLINLYPQSEYVEEARKNMAVLRRMFADHEFLVARYYARNKQWIGAQWRLQYLKDHYPEYPEMEKVDELLAKATAQVEEWYSVDGELASEKNTGGKGREKVSGDTKAPENGPEKPGEKDAGAPRR